ncbi:MAG: GUN4 domain-containing protein [Phormidium sp.]
MSSCFLDHPNCSYVPMSDRSARQSLRPSKIRVLYESEIGQIPCVDLHTINQLWMTASKGKFGFSVQKEIYQSVEKDYQRLGDRAIALVGESTEFGESILRYLNLWWETTIY